MTIILKVFKKYNEDTSSRYCNYKMNNWLLLQNVCSKWLAYTLAFFGKSGKDRQGNVFTKRPTYWAKLSHVFSSIFVYELYLILNFAST